MRRRERQALILALLAIDSMLALWAVTAALVFRHAGTLRADGGVSELAVVLLPPAFTLAMLTASGLYRLDDLFTGHREYGGVVRACTYAAFGTLFVAFLLGMDVARGFLIVSWGFSLLFLAAGRFVFRRAVFRLRRSGRCVRRTLIAGTDEHAIAISQRLSDPGSGWQIVGFLDDFQPVGSQVVAGLSVVGDPKAAAEVAETLGASDIILVPHAVSWEAQRDLVEAAATSERPALRLAPGLYHLLATGTRPIEANFVPLLSLERLRITGMDANLKTAIDYGLSLLALPALAVMLGLLRIAAWRSGGGPLLERRPAVGLRSEPFDLLALARPSDTAPTRGRWAWRLRRRVAEGKLGKLPNVLNVLKGGMSLVGPRALPAPTDMVSQPWTRTLMLVRPGITGPHASNGSGWSSEEQAILDVAYVRDYSFWLDLRLLFASLRRAVSGREALPASYGSHVVEETQPAEAAAT